MWMVLWQRLGLQRVRNKTIIGLKCTSLSTMGEKVSLEIRL